VLESLHAQVDGAVLCREVLQDFAKVLAAETEELLTLRAAAALSGYSEDHLGRLIRTQAIANAGRPGAPRIRRGDLPRRPVRVARGGAKAYDPDADARSLAIRRKEMAS
jgi:hypothetical protein